MIKTTPEKTIIIACEGKTTLQLDAIEEFQGNLKRRSKEDIQKLKQAILKYGFSSPFFVWHYNGRNGILDGHGRKKALIELRDEGYFIPPLPVVYIKASNETEAKQKLLLINSHYGNITQRGLDGFIKVEDIDFNIMNVTISKEAMKKAFQNDSDIIDKATTFPVIIAMNKQEYSGIKALKEKYKIKTDEKLIQELIKKELQND